jgi:hypothetical protein
MSDSHTELQKFQSHLPADDGWIDTAAEEAERLIKGTLLKFVDWRFHAGKQATLVPEGTKLIALATLSCWQLWQDGKVVKSIIREPGEFLPARATLSHPEKADEPGDPWANTRLVYFAHPVSAALYTFSTRSGGGRSAVSALAGQIKRMRRAHPNAVPLIELRAEEMPTKHGMKSKPRFDVIDWRFNDIAETEVPQEQRQLTASDDDFGADTSVDPKLNDEIAF